MKGNKDKLKSNDINKIRQDNISKEMLKIGVTPHLTELSMNGSGFKVIGEITSEQKKHIEKFAAGQFEIWKTLDSIVKNESGNWTVIHDQEKKKRARRRVDKEAAENSPIPESVCKRKLTTP